MGGKVHKLLGMKGSSGYAQTANDLFSYGAQEGMLGLSLIHISEPTRPY